MILVLVAVFLFLKFYLKSTENMFFPAFGRILTNGWFSCVFELKLFYLYSFLHNIIWMFSFYVFQNRAILNIVYGFFCWVSIRKVLV